MGKRIIDNETNSLRKTHRAREDRGAALIVVIGVMTVLLAVSISFFQMTRQEMQTATNATNRVRAELLSDGAMAVAMAFLNHDLNVHPTFTSLDHAWKTYFEGTWFQGKDWMVDQGVNTGLPLPKLNLLQMPPAGNVPSVAGSESLFWDLTRDQVYIPRFDSIQNGGPTVFQQYAFNSPDGTFTYGDSAAFLNNPSLYPFTIFDDIHPIVDAFGMTLVGIGEAPLTRAQFVHLYADIDNDGDGLRDSVWIPVGADTLFESDGLDNNLNNLVWETDGIDNDGDGVADEPGEGIDEQGEVGLFLYFGGNDGLDNNGVNGVDEAAEQVVYLTIAAPFQNDVGTPINFAPLLASAGAHIGVNPFTGQEQITQIGVNPPVDVVDNDYSMMVNDGLDARPVVRLDLLHSNLSIMTAATHAYAEPVTTLVGRMAIHIADEASKVNVGVAGAHVFEEDFVQNELDGALRQSVVRAIWRGAGPHEYETRVLPDVGPVRARRLTQFLNGAPEGTGGIPVDYLGDANPLEETFRLGSFSPYVMDISLPGFGRVDDNGDALWKTINLIDDDGDGWADEGLFRGNELDANRLGLFEGIDEPQERRRFRPLRNTLAEGEVPPFDNDLDLVENEFGEMGDRNYRTREQIKLALNIEVASSPFPPNRQTFFDELRNIVTVHSEDNNERHVIRTNFGFHEPQQFRAVTGVKLDYNYALAEDIAQAFREDFSYNFTYAMYNSFPATPGDPVRSDINLWARGLRMEGVTWNVNARIFDGIISPLADGGLRWINEDAELRGMQLAVNIEDNRDANHGRTELETRVFDQWFFNKTGHIREIVSTVSGLESIRINEIMVRPVRRVEAEMDPTIGPPSASPNPIQLSPENNRTVLMNYSNLIQGTPNFFNFGRQDEGGDVWEVVARTDYLSDRNYVSNDLDTTVVEFSFTATSLGLPEGRYYLMVNTRGEGYIPTVFEDEQMQYAIKYVGGAAFTRGGQNFNVSPTTITQDENNGIFPVPWSQVVVPGSPLTSSETGFIGFDGPESALFIDRQPTGFVFLTNRQGEPPPPIAPGYYQGEAGFTVYVPDPALGVELHVAIRLDAANAPPELAINFFDFSQEPDHEWVEIVNVAEGGAPIDVSGWELEVGTNINDEERTIMAIPPNTFIAAGGMLLLGTDKSDDFESNLLIFPPPLTTPSDVYNNGIGLARSSRVPGIINVTVPPITGFGGGPNDITDSVFWREAVSNDPDDFYDFVDTDGNGGLDLTALSDDGGTFSTTDFPLYSARQPWDRIVQLDIDRIEKAESAADIARLVLRGGIFPNYPEQDGIDNDNDNAILIADDVDNDMDVPLNLQLGDPAGGIDEDDIHSFLFGEGYDEGRALLEAIAGERVNGLLVPIELLFSEPGSFDFNITPNYYVRNSNLNDLPLFDPYLLGRTDAPEWKEFIERRFLPGDNVVVTLYAGTAEKGRIADRVTYRQEDVENRAIDDIVPNSYSNRYAESSQTNTPYEATLDRRLTSPNNSFWPENSMIFDFYRSLERKHPLYHGDKFGTQNRWQATDGNYDDWAPSTSRFVRSRANPNIILTRVDAGQAPESLYAHTYSGSPLRMNFSQRVMDNPFDGFGANQTTTLTRWAFERARVRNYDYISPGDLLTLSHYSDFSTLFSNTTQAAVDLNTFYGPPNTIPAGVFSGVPSDTSIREILVGQMNLDDLPAVMETTSMDSHVLSVAQAEYFPVAPMPSPHARAAGVDFQFLLQWTANDPPVAWTPVYLFDMESLAPGSEFFDYQTILTPQAGAQSFGDVYTMFPQNMMYLFHGTSGRPNAGSNAPPGLFLNNKFRGGMSLENLAQRWPIEDRIVMYVAANRSEIVSSIRPPGNFVPSSDGVPTNPVGADAYFKWDGEDGLENGEYDVYVVTTSNLDALRNTISNGSSINGRNVIGPDPPIELNDLVTDAASDQPQNANNLGLLKYIGRHNDEFLSEMSVNLEFLTDRDPDRDARNVMIANDFPFRNSYELLREGNSFGYQVGLTPNQDGVIHYGVVRVENNTLVMRISNTAPSGLLNRVSRVVLTPRNRTPGRMNINTVQTRSLQPTETFPLNQSLFNPLVGIPGMLANVSGAGFVSANTVAGLNKTNPVIFTYGRHRTNGYTRKPVDYDPAPARFTNTVNNNGYFDQLSDYNDFNNMSFGLQNVTRDNGLQLRRATDLIGERDVHADGRYYEFVSDLMRDRTQLRNPLATLAGLMIATPDQQLVLRKTFSGQPVVGGYRHDETRERLSRSANLMTTRSDVFEIIVTVQIGEGIDESGDGRINWRDDTGVEFVVTAEHKARMVYQR